MATTHARSQGLTRQDRKEIYHAVLGIVDAQTSPQQPPGVRRSTITRMLTPPEGPHDLEAVETAIRATREQDELLVWPDGEGRPRYTLASIAKLRRVAEWVGERTPETDEDPIVGWANRMVAEVRDD